MKFILPVLDVAPIGPIKINNELINGPLVGPEAPSSGMPTSLIVTLVVCGAILIGLTVFFIVKNKKNGGDKQ